jgi:hypothetical protein
MELIPLWVRDTVRGFGLLLVICSPGIIVLLSLIIFGAWGLLVGVGMLVTVFAWWCGKDFREFEERLEEEQVD